MGEGVLGGQLCDTTGQAEGPAASHLVPLEQPSPYTSAVCGDRPSRPGRAAGGAPRPIPGGACQGWRAGRGPGEPGGGERQLAGGLGGGGGAGGEEIAQRRRGRQTRGTTSECGPWGAATPPPPNRGRS
jgi:hypothetical protein